MTDPVLLFDFGGVLVDLVRERVETAFDRIGFDIRPYLGAFKQSGVFSLLEQGRISVPDFCQELRKLSSDAPLMTDEAIVAAWESFLDTVPEERLEMLLRIRRHYSVNLLSNTNAVHWRMAEEKFFRYKGLGVNDFFDHIFLSCKLGMEKPNPAIFRKVVEGLGAEASDVLFFDDSETNCQAARNCGLKALIAPAGSGWFNYFDAEGRLKHDVLGGLQG